MDEEGPVSNERRINKASTLLMWLSIALIIFGVGYRLGERSEQALKDKSQTPTAAVKFTPSAQDKENNSADQVDLTLFWNVWNNLQEKYVDQTKVKPEEMLYGAIKGMVASLGDPYTFFLTPKENESAKNDLGGLYEGIGAQLGLKNNNIIIVAPLKNSPAEREGLKSGDIIASINGESTKGMSLTGAVAKIRGTQNTKVKLKILRGKEELNFEINREEISVDSVELSYKKSNCDQKKACPEIAYIKVTQFGDKTNIEWDKAAAAVAQKWKEKQISGLILDLRSNPGGYLESAVYLASEFIPQNKLVVRQEYADKTGKNYNVNREGILPNIPLIVLIDQGSASASEILAGALRDYNKAKLIGQKTFGKGSVQEALDLQEGAGLHVTVAKWVLPKGDWINSKGIEPQIKVENKVKEGNTITDETDAQLQRALREIVK